MRNLFDMTGGDQPQDEIVVDLFAGGGGASEGIYQALGIHPHAAANHNPQAVSMHKVNHPDTVHYVEDVWNITPSRMTKGRPVGLLWASPDCTHFSKAKGGSPHRDERIRSLAKVITDKWLPEARPRVVIMENVEEFKSWCDLIPKVDKHGNPVFNKKTGLREMVPDPKKIDKNGFGNQFKAWVRKFRRYGYRIRWKELRACDYSAPTIRKRLFIIARCDDQPITWPQPTHGDPKSEAVKSGKLLPWRTAAECIDWLLPCPSIFDTSEEIKAKYGVRANRPLVENTLKRIAKGIQKYVVEAAEPFIVKSNHTASYYNTFRGQDINDPLQTVTKAPGFSVVTPYLTEHANGSRPRNMDVDEPLRTQCAQVKGGHFAVVAPHIQKMRGGAVGHDLYSPMHTVTAGGKTKRMSTGNPLALTVPIMEAYYGGEGSRAMRLPDIKEPMRTIPTENRFGLVSPTLIQTGYGEREGQAPRVPGLDKPLGTTVAGGVKHALVSGFLAKHFTGVVGTDLEKPTPTVTTRDHNSVVAASMALYCGQSVAQDVDEPARTVTGKERHGLVTCHIDRAFGESKGNEAQAPLGTTTANGGGHSALVASNMIKFKGTGTAYGTDEPIHTVAAGGLHHAEVRAFLMKYYSEGGQDQACDDPMHTLTTKARMGLVAIEGEEYIIVDIGMRMLQPRELFRAQGFRDSYIIDRDADGNKITKTDQVHMCGNSVCPDMAEALVSSNVELKTAQNVAA